MSAALRPGLLAAAAVAAGSGAMRCAPPRAGSAWATTNFRGARVSLLIGPLVTGAAVAGAPSTAAAMAACGAVAAGRYDDVAGGRPEQRRDKGFRGHLAALRAGRLSAGAVKVIGIGGTAFVAAMLRVRQESAGGAAGKASAEASDSAALPAEAVLDGLLLAGTANLVNLLDLRPGRAAKVVGLVALLGAVTAADPARPPFVALLGATAAALPGDLAERTMLGDAGANGLGILLGLAGVRATRLPARLGLLAVVAALTAASERVSFSAVIDRTPPLAWLDGLGRRG